VDTTKISNYAEGGELQNYKDIYPRIWDKKKEDLVFQFYSVVEEEKKGGEFPRRLFFLPTTSLTTVIPSDFRFYFFKIERFVIGQFGNISGDWTKNVIEGD